MRATLKRFWFWLAKNPPMLVSAGVILVAITVVSLSVLLSPHSSASTTANTTATAGIGRSGLSGLSGNPSWTYSQLVAAGAIGDLKSVVIAGAVATAVTKDGKTYDINLPDNTADLAKTLDAEGVAVSYTNPSAFTWSNILEVGLLLLLAGGFIFFFLRMRRNQGAGGPMGFGASKARIFDASHPLITFADVAGADEAKHEMQEIVQFLKEPLKFIKKGARIPRGVLLVGPPGTGKTLLSKAVAGESGATFYSMAGSEFVEMFVGVGASRVRDLFDKAKKQPASIIFVDEIDAIGRSREGVGTGGNEERAQTLNQLLVEMDGMDTAAHVIVIAATNRPDVLDPALLRPGRFDRHVTLDNPDRNGRLAILKVHARDKPFDPSVQLEVIARQTVGLSGADLANLLNEAAILSARYDHDTITLKDIDDATMRVIAGPEKKSRIINDHEKAVIAYHETGHALVMHTLPGNDPVSRVSITSRGQALGVTISNPLDDRYLMSKTEANARLAGIMGGRAAEALIFGDITSGAENDIQRATQLALRMVTVWGMSEKLGQIAMPYASAFSSERNVSPAKAEEIDAEVRLLIDAAYQQALSNLTTHRAALDRIAAQLIVAENIDGAELEALFVNA